MPCSTFSKTGTCCALKLGHVESPQSARIHTFGNRYPSVKVLLQTPGNSEVIMPCSTLSKTGTCCALKLGHVESRQSACSPVLIHLVPRIQLKSRLQLGTVFMQKVTRIDQVKSLLTGNSNSTQIQTAAGYHAMCFVAHQLRREHWGLSKACSFLNWDMLRPNRVSANYIETETP